MALGLAFFAYNLEQPLSIRSLFKPLLGERIYNWPGHTIDTVAAVATLFGVATSLGLGATQINAGLNHLFGIEVSKLTQILLIIFITSIATLSVVLGLKKGIQRLSSANITLATLLMLFVLLTGPTLFIANGVVENIGLYLDDFFELAFWNETYTRGDWQNGWTVFYWGWWIAWSPFVGMFIARISKGRTIREFITMALIVSTLTTFVWLSIFGNTALYIELSGPGGLADAVTSDLPRSLFIFLEMLPHIADIGFPHALQIVIGVVACVVVISFFVTSSDSGSLVVDIITAGGHPNPPVAQRIYWASMEGIVAMVLLAGGGLTALQTAAISSGLPFLVLLLLMIYCLHKALAEHLRQQNLPQKPARATS
jgi:choline/glycine/proline betaine transport protein